MTWESTQILHYHEHTTVVSADTCAYAKSSIEICGASETQWNDVSLIMVDFCCINKLDKLVPFLEPIAIDTQIQF